MLPIFFFLILGVVIAGFVFLRIITALTRRSSIVQTVSPSYSALMDVEIGADGFWILDASIDPGDIVIYRYICGGQSHRGSAVYSPGPRGHFVYTGAPPTNVEILEVRDRGDQTTVYDDDIGPSYTDSLIIERAASASVIDRIVDDNSTPTQPPPIPSSTPSSFSGPPAY
jgi:hypothetical protein